MVGTAQTATTSASTPAFTPMAEVEFHQQSSEFRRSYLKLLIGIAFVVFLVACMRAAGWKDAPGRFHTWQVALSLGAGLALTHGLYSQRPRLASWMFIVTLIGSSALELYLFPSGPALYLFSIIVVIAALLRSERGAVIVAMLVLAVMVAATLLASPRIPFSAVIWPALVMLFISFVSWLGIHQLYIVLRWEWHSTRQAIMIAEEAQNQRAEFARLNKELEGAYLRLDRMNRMLILARKEAEEARALKVQFASSVSHELRSPLNMILGFSDMMVNTPEMYGVQSWPPRLKKHLTQIHQNSQHLSQLIDDVLDMARIDAYRLSMAKEWMQLPEVITEAVEVVRGLYDARGLYLRLDLMPNPPTVLIDRLRIRQVMLNLLTNAARFTSEGGVTVRLTQGQSELVVGVSDTGAGIAPEKLPKLFQEFYQAVDVGASSQHYGGSGLGLAITKQLVELHGGRIWVESAPGCGSTFSFTLPLQVADSYALGLGTPPHGDEGFWHYLEQKAAERKPILVLHDSPTFKHALSPTLANYDVTWIANEVDLDQAAAEIHPFAVVHASVDTCAEPSPPIHLLHKLAGAPLITFTLPEPEENPAAQVFTRYLVKPISRQVLIQTLERLGRSINSVLVIEDEAAMREFLTLTLSNQYPQCSISEADCGQLALRLVANLHPDVILLDLNLPDMDGAGLTTQLRVLTKEQVPIIAVTAQDRPAEQGNRSPHSFGCTRLGRLGQREIERLLVAVLDALSPSAAPAA
ncbi:MAG: hybrid sensor histidine kinase/response regulator [Chloroflexi bacterium]|nr:hybrid sensor histidine kinase/response regulator [Chloroflexota bacterium]